METSWFLFDSIIFHLFYFILSKNENSIILLLVLCVLFSSVHIIYLSEGKFSVVSPIIPVSSVVGYDAVSRKDLL